LVANESSFALLTTEGEVYTWGDPRYSLGRDITEEEPATEPSIVPALEGLCITKISSGGWLAGALSEDRDLYIWGHTGNDGAVLEFIPDSPGDVGLVDLGESVDILDIAIGSGHVCVLTEGGDVYTAGRNENGQTGIPSEASYQSKWLKWERDWQGDVKSIFSGPFSWNTLVLVERNI
jgi:alpha-tubulin suppressor-like RCC1 family protein